MEVESCTISKNSICGYIFWPPKFEEEFDQGREVGRMENINQMVTKSL